MSKGRAGIEAAYVFRVCYTIVVKKCKDPFIEYALQRFSSSEYVGDGVTSRYTFRPPPAPAMQHSRRLWQM